MLLYSQYIPLNFLYNSIFRDLRQDERRQEADVAARIFLALVALIPLFMHSQAMAMAGVGWPLMVMVKHRKPMVMVMSWVDQLHQPRLN